MKTYLDWRAYQDAGMGDAYADIPKHGGDFAKAVAVCINARQCETLAKQVMCPSYKVSENPNLSTGGRVRLLKAALSHNLPEEALADPTLADAMDMCVACKGCKRECEANVDMALIKAEYQAQKVAREGLGLRARLFAFLPHWIHRYPWSAKLVRLRNRHAFLRWIGERCLGISAARLLPEPARQSFCERASHDPTEASEAQGREVVLFVDTFTRYFEPGIANAAIAVLKAAGFRITIAETANNASEPSRPLCCGRTFLAQGLVEAARNEVQRILQSLGPHIREGRTIIGLEASCILGLRDDARALGLGSEVEQLASNIQLFEEFLSKELAAKRLSLPLRSLAGTQTLVHGHCHQKAVGAMKAVRRILKHLPEHEFQIIESGCCGMAGTFGLEAEHGGAASLMAESELLPALRRAPESKVVSNGFSCRQQIRNHGDRRPRHLAELLEDALLREESGG